jgi:hypothetical protein
LSETRLLLRRVKHVRPTIATNAWANKEIFERVITDAGGLVTVCGGIVPIVEKLQHAFKKRTTTTSSFITVRLRRAINSQGQNQMHVGSINCHLLVRRINLCCASSGIPLV